MLAVMDASLPIVALVAIVIGVFWPLQIVEGIEK